MNDTDQGVVFGMVLGLCMGIALSVSIAFMTGTSPAQIRTKVQQEAVDHGVAEWQATSKGVVEFVWKSNE